MKIEDAGHGQDNAMTNGIDWFYPDNIDDARMFARRYGANPVNPDAFIKLFGRRCLPVPWMPVATD